MKRTSCGSVSMGRVAQVAMLCLAGAVGMPVSFGVEPLSAAPSAGGSPWVVSRQAVPSGIPETSVLEIEQVLPRESTQGQPFDYRIRLRNLTQCPLRDVVVLQTPPENVTVVGSFPQARARTDGTLEWKLGSLDVGGSAVIHARAVAGRVGPLTFCCDATYRLLNCATVQATRPALSVALDAPVEVTPCDEIPVRITVRNTGTGTCNNVRVTYLLPDGMVGPDGRKDYVFQLPTLPPGTARQADVRVKPTAPGVFTHRVVATSAEGLRTEAAETTTVIEPRLRVVQTGTDSQFAGRNVVYSFSVTNVGDAVARNVTVEDTIPAGVNVVATKPANGTRTGEKVVWRVPELGLGETMDFSVTVRSGVAGTFTNRVTARADCARDADAQYKSVVTGIAAILLEVVDRDDPIEVGGQETYVITATNQGTAVGTNLVVRCEFEDTMDYRSSDGPTTATVQGRTITFSPLAELAPKAKAVWTVTCGAKGTGDVRFKVILTSDQLTRPVEETESTHLY